MSQATPETQEQLEARVQAMIDAAKVPKGATLAEAKALLGGAGFDDEAADHWARWITLPD